MLRRILVASALALASVVGCTTTKVVAANDGDAPAGRREAEPCAPGDVTHPIDAFDVTPSDVGGLACDVHNVLDEDGRAGGITSAGAEAHELAGRKVHGCIGVEFGEDIVLTSLFMRMRPASGACGHSCTEGGKDGCGTGWKVAIFVGPSLDELEHLQQLSLTTPEWFEYRVAVYRSSRARFAVVCREPTPETSDGIEIDAFAGYCD